MRTEHPEAVATLQVQDQAQLVAVDRDVEEGVAVEEVRRNRPRVVALGRLDLDDLGPEVAELHGGEGAAQHPGEVQDAAARQRARILHQRAGE